MRLYSRGDCPFCWKVRLAMAELGSSVELVEVRLGEKHPDVVALNPGGTVPVLVDGGLVLGESAVIVEYLADIGGGGLLPTNAAARAQARTVHAYSDSKVGAALRDIVFEKRARPSGPWDDARLAAAEAAWLACQSVLARWLGGRTYFAGDAYSLAECALGPRFALAEHYGAAVDPAQRELCAWMARVRARPSWAAAAPAGFP